MTATATRSAATDQGRPETHGAGVGAGFSGPPTQPTDTTAAPSMQPSVGGWVELRTMAECYADIEATHTSITNRLRSGTIPIGPVADSLDAIKQAKTKLRLALKHTIRRVAPKITEWANATPGLDEFGIARLLGAIGDPLIASPQHWEGEGSDRHLVADPPFVRNLAKLWAYCGYGDPTRKRRKGMTADEAAALGQPNAKKILHTLAEACMKTPGGTYTIAGKEVTRRRSPYRDVYDIARARYDRDDWTPSHQHAAALRLVAKEILRDLWRVAHAEHPQLATQPTVSPTQPMADSSVGGDLHANNQGEAA